MDVPQLEGVEHRFVEVGGIRFHVAEAGPGDGDPLVLLHGWPQHWWEWRRLIPLLSGRYRVICPDLRGFGWSDAPRRGYDKETMAADVIGLLDALEIPRARLIGHDIGGYVAFLACLQAPERFQHLLTLNTGHPFAGAAPRAVVTIWRFWYWPILGMPGLGPAIVRRWGYRRMLWSWFTTDQAGWSAEDERIFAARLADPERALATSRTYRAFVLRDSPATITGKYRRRGPLQVPAKMLHGTDDKILVPQFIEGGERYGEDFTIELVPGCGHFIGEEAPELVADRALEFFGAAA